jgi:hypothetical protein
MPRELMSTSISLVFDDAEIANAVSSVVRIGNDLWVGADEGTSVTRLIPEGPARYRAAESNDLTTILALPAKERDEEGKLAEIDIEGMDWEPARGYLWLVGSHSLKRKKPKSQDSAEDSIKRLAKVSADGNRFVLGRIPVRIDATGASVLATTNSDSQFAARLECDRFGSELLEAFREDKLFARFLPELGTETEKKNIPGKDNGFDIEGLAVAGENRLFVGVRGPVLRGWACVIELRVDEEGRGSDKTGGLKLAKFAQSGLAYRRTFLELDGLGIRDLCFDGDDLLILAGPSMDIDWPAAIYRWNGARAKKTADAMLASDDAALSRVPVAALPPGSIGFDRAEALLLWPEENGFQRVFVAFDKPSPLRIAGDRHLFCEALQIITTPRHQGLGGVTETLWRILLETYAPLDFRPGCAAIMTELLLAGVQKMQRDNKTSPQDILRAQDNLQLIVVEMKRIAVEKNERWLNKAKFNRVLKRLASDKLRLWPFIPLPRPD